MPPAALIGEYRQMPLPAPLDLGPLFEPRNIALIGATEKSMWSNVIAGRLKDYAFAGQVFAVNRSGTAVHGFPGYNSCREIPARIDAAYIFVPADAVVPALEDAAAAGVRGVVVLTSGFAEIGGEGAALQERMVAIARAHGIALMGPNSLGYANIAERRALTPIAPRQPLIDGGVAIVSQSGAVVSEVAKFAHQQGVGTSFMAATGNEAMLGLADIAEYLVDHAPTRVIAMFAETINDPDRLRTVALRARAARKSIVILKVGRSALTAAVAQAHTGSLVGDDAIFDAACRQLGMIRVASIEELVLTAALIDRVGPLERPGVAVVSMSGGGAGMFADHAEGCGVDLPAFSQGTVSALTAMMPVYGGTLNPLDITGATVRDPALWTRVLPIVAADTAIGLVAVIQAIPAIEQEVPGQTAQWSGIVPGLDACTDVPGIIISQALQPVTEVSRNFTVRNGAPLTAQGIEFTVKAIAHLARWSASLSEAPRDQAVAVSAERPQGERAVFDFLVQHGVGVVPALLANSANEAAAHAATIGGQVVLKIASGDIAHKTELGGVKLNLSGEQAVRASYDAIRAAVAERAPDARIDGVIVAPMRSGGIELFVGTVRDPQWGAAIVVGLGGIWVEALQDTATRLLPVSRADVKEMLGELRGAPLLKGFRGSVPADRDALADTVVRIGNAALTLGDALVSLEVNPLLVDGSRVEALDALTIFGSTDLSASTAQGRG